MRLRSIVVFISGFRQSAERFNGVFRQFREAASRRREMGIADARIEYRTWRSEWDAFAEYTRSLLDFNGEVWIVGYSWGAGWGAKRLAVELNFRGLTVPGMLLCDPVYRSPVLPAWLPLNPLSLIHKRRWAPKIYLPSNIRNVRWLRQDVSRPQAHQLVAVNPQATVIHPPKVLQLIHSEMDESNEFAAMSRELVNQAFHEGDV